MFVLTLKWLSLRADGICFFADGILSALPINSVRSSAIYINKINAIEISVHATGKAEQ
jgi:hypothetical protein